MLFVKNNNDYRFEWPDGSPYVEVYSSEVVYSDQPFEVIDASALPRNESTLRVLAFSTSEYNRS
jgi:hypothetical protein